MSEAVTSMAERCTNLKEIADPEAIVTQQMNIELGLMCGGVVVAIKVAAFNGGVTCEHMKGPGWLSAKHHFKFTAKRKVMGKFMYALDNYINGIQAS
jgi:hypothetical protein